MNHNVVAIKLAGRNAFKTTALNKYVLLGSNVSQPKLPNPKLIDISVVGVNWTPMELDNYLNSLDTSTLIGKTLILPNVYRTPNSTVAFWQILDTADAVEWAGNVLNNADELLSYLVLQGNSETGAEGDIYWNRDWYVSVLDGRTSSSDNDLITLIERGNSFI